MPKKIGTEMWRRKRQQGYLEMKEYRYYIFCEGLQTEPLYFQGFKRLIEENPIYREMVLIEIEPCGAETLRVIHQAERYVKENQISKGQIPRRSPRTVEPLIPLTSPQVLYSTLMYKIPFGLHVFHSNHFRNTP